MKERIKQAFFGANLQDTYIQVAMNTLYHLLERRLQDRTMHWAGWMDITGTLLFPLSYWVIYELLPVLDIYLYRQDVRFDRTQFNDGILSSAGSISGMAGVLAVIQAAFEYIKRSNQKYTSEIKYWTAKCLQVESADLSPFT